MRLQKILPVLGIAALAGLPSAAPAADTKAAPSGTPVQSIADVKEIDVTGLSDAQKKTALKVMNANPCNCGCDKSTAQCRRDMANSCRRSLIFARTVVDALREGKDEAGVTKTLQAKAATFVEAKVPDDTGQVYQIDVSNAPVRGPKAAPVRMIEFSDFQCPYCAELEKTLDQVLKAFPKDVQLVYKQFPLNIHQYSRQAAAASLIAHSQGKFWELHDHFFQNFTQIDDNSIRRFAKEAGLDMNEFEKAMQSGKYEPVVQKDMADGAAAKVMGTPTLFINGKRVHDRSFEGLKKAIQEELAAHSSAPSSTAAAVPPSKTAH